MSSGGAAGLDHADARAGVELHALETAEMPIESAELTLVPKTTVELDEDAARKLLRLIDALEDNDDVQDVYANFDISDAVLEAVAG